MPLVSRWFRYCAWCKGWTFRMAHKEHTDCIACLDRGLECF